MNENKKYRMLWFAILGLLVLNLGTLAWVVFDKRDQRMVMSPFIIEKDLNFDKTQREKFEVFKDKHFKVVLPIRDSLKILKSEAIDLVKADVFDNAALESKLNEITKKIRSNEMATITHFSEIRSLCTPEQKEIFDTKILDGIKRMGENGKQGGLPPPRM